MKANQITINIIQKSDNLFESEIIDCEGKEMYCLHDVISYGKTLNDCIINLLIAIKLKQKIKLVTK